MNELNEIRKKNHTSYIIEKQFTDAKCSDILGLHIALNVLLTLTRVGRHTSMNTPWVTLLYNREP